MAGEMDGSNFVGQDDNAFGDGTTDSNSKPLSVRAENRLDANTRYLHKRGSQVAYQFFGMHGGDNVVRPFTSEDWSTLLLVPWESRKGLDTIRARIWATVANDGGVTGEVDARVVLFDGRQRYEGTATTMTGTGSNEAYRVSLDLSGEDVQDAPGYLALEITSTNSASGSSGSLSTFADWGITYSDGGTLDNAIDETVALLVNASSDGFDTDTMSEVYHKSTVTSSSHVSGLSEGGRGIGSAVPIDLSYIEPLAVHIEERFDADKDSRGYTVKGPRTMQGQKPVLGQHVSGHGTNLDDRQSRPTCKAIGPHGQDTNTNRQSEGEGWPSGFRRKWSWINVTDETDTELDRQSIQFRHDGSDIRMMAYIVGFYQVNPDDLTPANRLVGVEVPEKSEYTDRIATADLDLDITVEQMQGTSVTSWNDATELVSETVTERSFPLLQEHPAPFDLPSQVFWARHPSGPDSTASQFRFTFHEGQLWRDDYQLFGPAPIVADLLVSDSMNKGDPVRCNLDFNALRNTDLSETGFSTTDNTFKFHLLCLQTSWWELPSL